MSNRSLFIETIKIHNSEIFNLQYHQDRFNKTQTLIYGKHFNINLNEHINIPDNKLYRCRIEYSKSINSVEFYEYTPNIPKKLTLVHSNIDYSLKYIDRDVFTQLQKSNHVNNEIIVVKNNMLTDTTIANIALLKNGIWYTPKQPLLNGTTRARLINEGTIVEENIDLSTIDEFERIAVMNAMTDFVDLGTFKLTDNEIIMEN